MPEEITTEKIKEEFEHIYVSYYSRMLRFACEYTFSEEDAKNIVHDVFAELWEMRNVYMNQICVVSFIFTSIKNKCIDYFRHKMIVRETENILQEEYRRNLQIKYDSLEAFDQNLLTDADIEEIIKQALNTLPERCREIFIKSKFEGKKQKEIARELNLSLNTIETQMGIAYKKLREALKEYLPLFLFLFHL
jgi:RNA polymerase sigma-70 factor (ECF subfamily)